MKRYGILLLGVFFLLQGCKKDKAVPQKEEDLYVTGDVVIGLTNTLSIKEVFDSLNILGLHIASINALIYNSGLPADSIPYLKNLLDQKTALNPGGFNAHVSFFYPDNTIRVNVEGSNMTLANQEEFLKMLEDQALTQRDLSFGFMVLRVQPGTEKFWVQELRKRSFLAYADLNHVSGGFFI